MTDELRQKVQALRAIAPRLNAATDEAASIVKVVEDLLGQELSLGLACMSGFFAEQPAEEGEEGQERRTYSHLAYDRINGTYRLHVLEQTCGRDFGGDFTEVVSEVRTPWSSCPRQLKLQSFAMLPSLLEEMAAEAMRLADRAESTSRTVRDLIEALQPDQGPTIPAALKAVLDATPEATPSAPRPQTAGPRATRRQRQ